MLLLFIAAVAAGATAIAVLETSRPNAAAGHGIGQCGHGGTACTCTSTGAATGVPTCAALTRPTRPRAADVDNVCDAGNTVRVGAASACSCYRQTWTRVAGARRNDCGGVVYLACIIDAAGVQRFSCCFALPPPHFVFSLQKRVCRGRAC